MNHKMLKAERCAIDFWVAKRDEALTNIQAVMDEASARLGGAKITGGKDGDWVCEDAPPPAPTLLPRADASP